MTKVWRIGSRHDITWTGSWAWPEKNFRFNGGGYLYGARPYKEFVIGPLRFRHYVG